MFEASKYLVKIIRNDKNSAVFSENYWSNERDISKPDNPVYMSILPAVWGAQGVNFN